MCVPACPLSNSATLTDRLSIGTFLTGESFSMFTSENQFALTSSIYNTNKGLVNATVSSFLEGIVVFLRSKLTYRSCEWSFVVLVLQGLRGECE